MSVDFTAVLVRLRFLTNVLYMLYSVVSLASFVFDWFFEAQSSTQNVLVSFWQQCDVFFTFSSVWSSGLLSVISSVVLNAHFFLRF
jgi:hypothetical protein